MAKWRFRVVPDPQKSKGHPLVTALLALRGITTDTAAETFFAPDYDRDLHDPFLFSDMSKVVERIAVARGRGETVGLFGDFDADGVTATVTLHEALTMLGLAVSVYIPEKESEGHGLNHQALAFFQGEKATLLITLDCGMMNHAEIATAHENGVDVIVVDHHHVPEVLPPAYAIINPKLPNETYPFTDLCGAGTAFKVAQALFRRLDPPQEEQLKWLLDVVATGTVADVMPLVGENRVLVKYGLIVLSKTRRVGFQEMFSVGGLGIGPEREPVARDIAFAIAPRINAASRMTHALLAYRLLCERSPSEARILALELEAQNGKRQKLSTEVTAMVRTIAKERYAQKKYIVAVSEHYPFGIVGLVAGRIANESHKPTCVLKQYADVSRGSFRSIPEFNVIAALEQCADLVEKYGGHAQAAGMTIRNEQLPAFEKRFAALVEKELQAVVTEPEIWVDSTLDLNALTPGLVRELARMAPFGEGNPEPIFCFTDVVIREAKLVGNGKKHWKLRLSKGISEARVIEAIGFSLGETYPHLEPGLRLDVLATLGENTWNGKTSVQLRVCDVRTNRTRRAS